MTRVWSMVLAGSMVAAGESFEQARPGGFTGLDSGVGRWIAAAGHAEVHAGHAKSGRQSLRIMGGAGRELTLELPAPLERASRLTFWAERWTARAPFELVVEAAAAGGGFRETWNGGAVKVGGFHTRAEVPLAAGVSRLRWRCTSPPGGGLMIDEVALAAETPMRVERVEVTRPPLPVLLGRDLNPVLGVKVVAAGALEPLALDAAEVTLAGTTRPAEVEAVEWVAGGEDPSDGFGRRVAGKTEGGGLVSFRPAEVLEAGANWWWLSVRLKPAADLAGRVDAALTRLVVGGKEVAVPVQPPGAGQRIGIALRRRGDDGSAAYRIPGLARTKAGSLVAVYDIRRRGGGDLPADIDVGVSRSTDGGRHWEPMRVAIDMGNDPRHAYDGVGDPCVFVDQVSGRIWIAALWSHGKRAWHGSGPGLTPEQTGQLVMVHSDDDGKSWSRPVNITRQVKDPAWRLLLAGPGTGITTRDGTLAFPAQFRAADGKPFSTLIWSKDRGATWHVGSGVKSDTTEAQLVELGDGRLMINCRDDRGGARTVAVTRDLGASWELHPTDRKALPESVCMASLLRWEVPGMGPRLFFSNPATTSGRHSMTVKVSEDEGMSWPQRLHTLYDIRRGAGYSCLAPADDEHLGVLYEGPTELYFLRLPVRELLAGGAGAGEAAESFDPGTGARAAAPVPLLPFPRRVEWGRGTIPAASWRVEPAGDTGRARDLLGELPQAPGGTPLRVATGAVAGAPADVAEAYTLSADENGVRLVGAGDAGLLAGFATLRQLAAGGRLPAVRISDWPAFPVRGFMHDTGRNFQSVATLERFIGLLADHKLNLFHWHLADRPGYRIESRRHPRLNAPSSYLPGRSPGKFYTFDEIRGLIRRAHGRGVEVLPEIDMPGHSDYFRRAFGCDMQDARGAEICAEMLEEFCDEVVEPLRREGVRLPRLHLGADEVQVRNRGFLPALTRLLRARGLEVVTWRPGALPDAACITQLWAKGRPLEGSRFIDSAVNYVNHMDFLDSVPHAFFRQPCGQPAGDARALGAILCHWPDVNAGSEENIYRQSPVVPALLACAERFWRGLPRDHRELWARLPAPGDPRLEAFALFERDLVARGRQLAVEWPIPYVAQAALRWRVIGPFDHGGDVSKSFPPEHSPRLEAVEWGGKRLVPFEVAGGTIHFRHFFGTGGVLDGKADEGTVYAETRVWSPDDRQCGCWIGFNSFSTSDRRGGPVPAAGEWNNEGGKLWVNGAEVRAPAWRNAGYMPRELWADERPFADEGYAARAPTQVRLRQGWNRVLAKVPRRKTGWKWMFTFVPLDEGLKTAP